jgi:hypothetical protein
MPNHVHVLVQMIESYDLSSIVKGWKSYSARKINDDLGRSGRVWQIEFWDRYIRNEEHYFSAIEYIHQNPVKAGLAQSPDEWPWSCAWERRCPHLPFLCADEDVRAPGLPPPASLLTSWRGVL